MKNVTEEMDNLTRLMKMIAAQFGDKCEVVLHDLTKGYEHTIVAIENNHVTSRQVGDCGSNLGLEVLRGHQEAGDSYNYVAQLKNGNILRCSSMYLRDDKGDVIGSLCINFDITDLLVIENSLKEYSMFSIGDSQQITEIFANNVNELMVYFIQECQKLIGKPAAAMTKEDKIKAVEFLDNKGVFLITKSGDRVCEYLNISKYTLYNYLDIARKNANDNSSEALSE